MSGRLPQWARCDLTQVNHPTSFCLMQLNVGSEPGPYAALNNAKPEVIMLEFYEPGAAIVEDAVARTVTRLTKTNKSALDFMFGAQKAMLEQMIFAGNEILDRARTETHLFSEFSSKIGGAHSVKDLKAVCGEWAQPQTNFVRRACARLFKQGERMIEPTSSLFNRPQDQP